MALPAEVSEILEELVEGAREVLGDNLVGIYLRGSLALGDFNPATSDIDFLAVTKGQISEKQLTGLSGLHEDLARRPGRFAQHIEGSYVDRGSLKRFRPHERRHPTIGSDWPLGMLEHKANWTIQRWIVRERGVALYGPDAKSLIDPISPDELRSAVRADLLDPDEWGAGAETWPTAWLIKRNYQAFAVETMCRALYTLATGEVATKPQAVAWALGWLEEPWRSLVQHSQSWREDETEDPSAGPEVKAFVRYVAQSATTNDDAGLSRQ